MKQTNYQKQVKEEKKILRKKRLDAENPVNNGKRGMDAVKRHLWTRGIRARDVSLLHTGYDLLVDNFWKVECKSSKPGSGGYVIINIEYMKFDILAIALFDKLLGKYKIFYLKQKQDLALMTQSFRADGAAIDAVTITKEKIEAYFTSNPKEIFIKPLE